MSRDQNPQKSKSLSSGVEYVVAICMSTYHGPILIPTSPHPLTGAKAPIIMGHEFSGEVMEVGHEVKQFSVGRPSNS